MSSDTGWRPFRPPIKPQRTVTSAFTRLARVHLASTSGDAAVAVALAGSLFFSLPSGQARGKVLLYLLLTMAPFVVVAPLVGPFLDRMRGARRIMVIVSAIGRALLCFVMIGHVKSLLFFPEAFGVLILQKTYSVTKPALVPTTVATDEELVEANSKLSILSGVATATGAGPAGIAYKLGGAQWSLGIALVIYLIAAALATQLPRAQVVAADPTTKSERAELQTPSILLGASAIAMVRGLVGFLTLFLAFEFHREGVPLWKLAVVGISSVAGSLIGALIAPALRRRTNQEETLLLGALFAIVVGGLAAVLLGGLNGAMALAVIVGIGAAVGKLAFDSIVQRDAPDANRGRSFARFETRFQAAWVIGAVIAIIPMPSTVGYVVILIIATVTALSYVIGAIAARARASNQPPSGIDATAVEIDERMSAIANDTKQRLRRAAGSALQRGISGPIGRRARRGTSGGEGSSEASEASERGPGGGPRRSTGARGPAMNDADVDTAGWRERPPDRADIDTSEVPIVPPPPPPQPSTAPPGTSSPPPPPPPAPPQRSTEAPGSPPAADPPASPATAEPSGSTTPPPPSPPERSSPPVGRGASPRR